MMVQPSSLAAELLEMTSVALDALPGACELAVPPVWARRQGKVRDQAITLHSRAWETPSLAWVRALLMDGGARSQIFALLTIPRAAYDLPLLGAETVHINGRATLLALDWIPLFGHSAYLAPLTLIHPRYAHFPPYGETSAWAATWLSPYAIHSRPMDAISDDEILAAYSDYLTAYLDLAEHAVPGGNPLETVATQRRFFLQYHAENPGHAMLARIFDEQWATDYAHEFLFRPGGEPL